MTHSKAFSGFSVDDINKARAFYQGTLGLKVNKGLMGILELETEGNNSIIIYSKPDLSPRLLRFSIFR